ncbi:hypothetical protein PFISCL1PPCAC_8907, partial [Pristionchus fissidentatus]
HSNRIRLNKISIYDIPVNFQDSLPSGKGDLFHCVVARSAATKITSWDDTPKILIDAFRTVCESAENEEKFVFVYAPISVANEFERIMQCDKSIHCNDQGWLVDSANRTVLICRRDPHLSLTAVIMGKVSREGRIIDEKTVEKLNLKWTTEHWSE